MTGVLNMKESNNSKFFEWRHIFVFLGAVDLSNWKLLFIITKYFSVIIDINSNSAVDCQQQYYKKHRPQTHRTKTVQQNVSEHFSPEV
jgi:hypothetical protein